MHSLTDVFGFFGSLRVLLFCLYCCDTSARIQVSKDGSLSFSHDPQPEWDITKYVIQLSKEGMAPGEIYWRLWGLSSYLFCVVCELMFPVAEVPSLCSLWVVVVVGD